GFVGTAERPDLWPAVPNLEAAIALYSALIANAPIGMVDAVPAFLYMFGPDGSIEFINQRFLDYTGISQQQARGGGWSAVIHPDDLPVYRDRWAESVATSRPFEQDLRMRQAGGGYRWFRTRALPVQDADGGVARWCGASVDIDQVRQA